MSLAKELEIFLDAIKKNLIEQNFLTKLGKKKLLSSGILRASGKK